MKNIIKTPLTPVSGPPSISSSGVFNGEPGLPKRSSSSGPPEKTLEKVPGGPPKGATSY